MSRKYNFFSLTLFYVFFGLKKYNSFWVRIRYSMCDIIILKEWR